MYLDPAYQGRGLGRQLYERLITEVRDLGYRSLYAGIALPNPASVGLHEALGFTPVGVFRDVGYKLGAWRDVGWWQSCPGRPGHSAGHGPRAEPAEPRPRPNRVPGRPEPWPAASWWSSAPRARPRRGTRNHNGYLLRWDGEGLLFDPGEGTQRQMLLAGVRASEINRICVTHFHGDHCLGLPGVLQRIALDRVDP